MFEQRTRSEAIDVSPNMRGICRGSSEVGGGVDVGILFEENITVARFYWLPNFKSPTATSSISAFKGPENDIIFPRPTGRTGPGIHIPTPPKLLAIAVHSNARWRLAFSGGGCGHLSLVVGERNGFFENVGQAEQTEKPSRVESNIACSYEAYT